MGLSQILRTPLLKVGKLWILLIVSECIDSRLKSRVPGVLSRTMSIKITRN